MQVEGIFDGDVFQRRDTGHGTRDTGKAPSLGERDPEPFGAFAAHGVGGLGKRDEHSADARDDERLAPPRAPKRERPSVVDRPVLDQRRSEPAVSSARRLQLIAR